MTGINERLDYYSMPEPMSGCWLWTRPVSTGGYATLCVDGKGKRAHRLSWERHNGPIPIGLYVLHKCDTPSCINPEHLFVGTQKDNIQDAVKKGRMATAVLSQKQVLVIRDDARSSRTIAAEYGVTHRTILEIRRRETWKWLT